MNYKVSKERTFDAAKSLANVLNEYDILNKIENELIKNKNNMSILSDDEKLKFIANQLYNTFDFVVNDQMIINNHINLKYMNRAKLLLSNDTIKNDN